jgi:hypothetical protein
MSPFIGGDLAALPAPDPEHPEAGQVAGEGQEDYEMSEEAQASAKAEMEGVLWELQPILKGQQAASLGCSHYQSIHHK